MEEDDTIQPNYLEIGSEPATSNEGFDMESTPEANSPTTPPTPTPTTPNIVQLGEDGVLTFGTLRSPNFSSGNSGWRITSNGDVEFGSGYFRGDITGASGTFSGTITATTGAIGGFNIGSDYIRDVANSMGMASTVSGSDDVRFWAGDTYTNRDTAPFRVYESGLVVATNAVITIATLGGFDIGSDYIRDTGNSFGLASTVTGGNDVRFWAGDTFTNRATAELRIYEDGSIIGTNATFTGALFATSGWIGSATALVYESQGINTGTTGFIRGGQTSYNTGTGYFLGYDTGAYKLSIGNTTNYLTWDGTELTVAGTFNIGGTTITIDNTQDIQDYLDEIETAGGGTLWLQPGTYTLTADIFIPSGVVLQGTSRDGVIIDCDGFNAVKIAGSNAYSTGTVTINNGDTTVVGSGTTWTSGMVGRYILLDGLWYEITARTDNTHITITEYQGVNLSGSVYVLADVNFATRIKDLTITGAAGAGLVVEYAMEPNINNLVIYGCGTGIDMDYVTYPKIEVTCNENGVNLNMNYVEGFFVDYCDLSYSTSGNGVTMTNTRNSTFFNSSVNDNTGDGINLTTCSKIAFISFDISGNGGQGVEMVSGCDDNQFTDGVIQSNTSDGIKLTATSDRNIFTAISIKSNGGYGINIAASTCDNNQIVSPAFLTNTSGNISDSGTSTIILPNTPSFIADEDLTAGQPVGISNYVSGKVARALRFTPTTTIDYTVTTNIERQNSTCPIGGDKFVFINYNDGADTLYATVGTVAPSTKTITLGTSVAVTADITASYFCMAKLDTDKFIVFYREDASTTIIKYRVGTVSGTVITFGSATTFATGATAVQSMVCDYISANKGIMFYSTSTVTDSRLIAFTVSGTTATAGTPSAIGTTIDDQPGNAGIKKIATDKFIIATDSTGVASNYCQVGTLSGTTITLGTETVYSTNDNFNTSTKGIRIVSPSDNVAVIYHIGASSIGETVVGTISGTTPTFGTPVAGNQYDMGLYADSTSSVLIGNGVNGYISKFTFSGTTLTSIGNVIQRACDDNNIMIPMDNGYFIVIQTSGTTLTYMVQGMSNNFFGMAESTVSRGGSVGVITSGKVGGNSGLIPGGYYQVTSTGLVFAGSTATQNTVDDKFVLAVSDTEVVL